MYQGLKLILNADTNSPSPTLTGFTSFPGTHLGGKRAKRVVAHTRTVPILKKTHSFGEIIIKKERSP